MLCALKSHQGKAVIYFEEHQSVDVHAEQGVLEGFLERVQLSHTVVFNSAKYAVRLDS